MTQRGHEPGRPARRSIDLNADAGESAAALADGSEAALLDCVSSANIACGGHAGDEQTMAGVAALCRARGVAVGAHPSFPDRAGFGRVDLALAADEVEAAVAAQIAALGRIVRALGADLTHVKPHGALYHAVSERLELADAVASAARAWRQGIVLVGPSRSAALLRWRYLGLPVRAEAFADRRYEQYGVLRSRSLPGAVLDDPQAAATQAVRLARGQGALTEDGQVVLIDADTICLHGDTPGALALARAVRRALTDAGIAVRAPA